MFLALFSIAELWGQSNISTIRPRSNEVVTDSIVYLQWNASNQESPGFNYRVIVAEDLQLLHPIYTSNTVLSEDTLKLDSSGKYFWKIDLIYNGELIAHTDTLSFRYFDLFREDDLSLLLRADTGLLTNGLGQIEKWYNLRDTANSAVQPILSQRPNSSTNSRLKGLNVVSFDGTDDVLQINNSVRTGEVFLLANWEGGSTFNNLNGLFTGKTTFVGISAAGNNTTSLLSSATFPTRLINRANTLEFSPLENFKVINLQRASTFTAPNMQLGRDRTNTSRYWHGDIAEVLVFENRLSDSSRSLVHDYFCNRYGNPFYFGPDIEVAYGFCDTLLTIDTNYVRYQWSTGDTTYSANLSPSNSYQITVTDDFGCTYTDEIYVTTPLTVPGDQFLCLKDTFLWDTRLSNVGYTFNWSNGDIDSLLLISAPGSYSVVVSDTNGCTFNSDTIQITYDSSLASVSLGPDTSVCEGSRIGLKVGSAGIQSYLWNTGNTQPIQRIDTAGIYSVRVGDGKCFVEDTIALQVSGEAPTVNYSSENRFVLDTVQFTDLSNAPSGDTLQSWLWEFGDGASSMLERPKHVYQLPGKYLLKLTVETNKKCTNFIEDSIRIRVRPPVVFANKDQDKITIVQPKNETSVFDPSVIFEWNSSKFQGSNSKYRLTIANDSNLMNIVSQEIAANSFSDTVSLMSAVYYWRVDLMDSTSIVASSEVNSFTKSDVLGFNSVVLNLRSDSGLVLEGNGEIRQWYNLVDTSKSAIQSNASQRPTLTSNNNLTGRNVVTFDGVDDLMEINSSFPLGEVFLVANWEGGSTFTGLNGLFTGKSSYLGVTAAGNNTTSLLSSATFPIRRINRQNTLEFAPLEKFKVINLQRSVVFNAPNVQFGRDRSNITRYWDGAIAEVLAFSSQLSDSARNIVHDYFCSRYGRPFNFGPDIVNNYGFCDTLVQVDNSYLEYHWSNGDSTNFSRLFPGQSYRITVTDEFGCEHSDEISVSIPARLEEDQLLCIGDTFVWDTKLSNSAYSFVWNNGVEDSLLSISEAGSYFAMITDSNACRYQTDTIEVSFDSSLLSFTLGSDTAICKGQAVGILNANSTIQSYQWSTGNTDSLQFIDSTGTYSVRLGNGNCFFEDTISINVKGAPAAVNFIADRRCFQDTVVFTDSSRFKLGDSIIRWRWDFGDGDISSLQNPRHNFKKRANYDVLLEVETDKGCVSDTTLRIRIEAKPLAKFSIRNSCAIEDIKFSDSTRIERGTISSYKWNFGDTSSLFNTSNLKDPTHQYDTSGTYAITLIVTSDQGCTDSVQRVRWINPLPVVSYAVEGSCLSDSTRFYGQSTIPVGSISEYLWVINNRQIKETNPTVKYLNSGRKGVVIRVTSDSSCSAILRDSIDVFDAPLASFLVEDYCLNESFSVTNTASSIDSINYTQYVFKGDTIRNALAVFKSTEVGQFDLQQKVSTVNGCSDSTVQSVTIYPNPTADFNIINNNTGIPFEIVLQNNSLLADDFLWHFGNGDTSQQPTPVYTYNDTGTFQLQLNVQTVNGCSDSAIKDIIALPKRIDAALKSLFLTEKDDGSVEISVRILNTGSNTLNTVDLTADLNNDFEFKETFIGPLYNGNEQSFTFQSSFLKDGGRRVDFVCVRIGRVNQEADVDPSNNELCQKGFNEELILNVYPNPVRDLLNIEYVLPTDGRLEMNVYDALGKESILPIEIQGQEGFYTSQINVSSLESGLYFYAFSFKGKTELIKFFKY